MSATPSALWISWERQRRSIEMADALGVPLVILQSSAPYYLRALTLSFRTAGILLRRRPRILFVQNPSMVLALVACLLRPLLRYRLVVDRHSNFMFVKHKVSGLEHWLHGAVSRFTLRKADLTIVTNETLRRLIEEQGGRGFVLQDRPPTLALGGVTDLGPGQHVVYVASHAPDEPVAEVVAAARSLGPQITVHITGNAKRSPPELVANAPGNVRFTGFLSEADYQTLLRSSAGVIALTKMPATLLCCAYEALAVGKPMVLSDQEELRRYFHAGAVPTDNTAEGIAAAIRTLLERRDELAGESRRLAVENAKDWHARFERLLQSSGMSAERAGVAR